MINFIVNPCAGSGKSIKAVHYIREVMESNRLCFKLYYTKKAGDRETILSAVNRPDVSAVVSVGGDGTIQDIIPSLIGKKLPLGIIPSGSGNDFINSVPGFKKSNGSFAEKIRYYTEKIIKKDVMTIDALSVKAVPDNEDEKREFFSINIASCGFDAAVAASTLGLKKIFGKTAYFVAVLKQIFAYKPMQLQLAVDGQKHRDSFLLNAVSNGSFYGGGFNISPNAKIDDGKITLCSVTRLGKLKILVLFPSVLFGKHVNLAEVSQTDCKEIIMEFDGSQLINLDGNLISLKSPIEFKILPSCISLIV